MATNTATQSPIRFVGAIFLNLTRAMLGAYGLSATLFLIMNVAIGEENWVVLAFFNTFAHLIWMPALILLPICLLFRAWHLTFMLIPVVAIFGWVYGERFLPQDVSAPTNAQMVTVATYNVQGSFGDTASAIRQLDADVIALQEVGGETVSQFENNLVEDYPYYELHPQNQFTKGQGIISRYPIIEDEYWQYDWLPIPLGHQRSIIQLDDGTQLVFYNVHPTHPGMSGSFFNPQYRFCELQDILRRSLNETSQVVLLGDFNMPELSVDYQTITQYYTDVFDAVGSGMGFTFPASDDIIPAFLRLDYAFVGEGITPITATRNDANNGSDHYPLHFQIAIEPLDNPRNIIIPAMPRECQEIMGGSSQ